MNSKKLILIALTSLLVWGCEMFENKPLKYSIHEPIDYYGSPFISANLIIQNEFENGCFSNKILVTIENHSNTTYDSLLLNFRFYDTDSNNLIAEKRHLYTNIIPGTNADTIEYLINSQSPITGSFYFSILDISPAPPSSLTNLSGGYIGPITIYKNSGDSIFYQFNGNISIDGKVHFYIPNLAAFQTFEGIIISPTQLTGKLSKKDNSIFSDITVDSISFSTLPYYLNLTVSTTNNSDSIQNVVFKLYND